MPLSLACCGMTLSVCPASEHADRHHRRFQGVDVARHDRLQLVDDLGPDQNGVDRQMRPRRVPAFAFQRDLDVVGRRHHRPGADAELSERNTRIIMHAVDFLDAEAADQSVLDHGRRAGAALLRRLENHHRRAGEVARLGEIFGGAKEHRGMPVMAAGVHLAGDGRLIRQAGFLLDRQRIHVGPHADNLAAGFSPADDADHAGAPDAGHDLVAAEALELVGNRGRGAMHVVAQFRMGMKIPPPFFDFAMQIGNAVDYGHRGILDLTPDFGRFPAIPRKPSKAQGKKRARGARGW